MSLNHPHLKSLQVETIQFKRVGSSVWEDGVCINNGDGPIIDMDGKVVPSPIGDFRATSVALITVFSDEEE